MLAILNFSTFDFHNQGNGPTGEAEIKEENVKEESESGSTVGPSDEKEILTLVELRDAAVEALRSCSACAPHR